MHLYYKLNKDISHISQLYQKYPRDPFIRGKFFLIRKNVLKTIQQAEIIKNKMLLNKIQEAEQKEPNTLCRVRTS